MRLKTGHLRKRGTIWYIIYKEAGKHKWVSTGLRKREEAEIKRRELMAIVNSRDRETAFRMEADRLAAERSNWKAQTIQLSEIWDLFEASNYRKQIAAVTLESYRKILCAFLVWLEKNHPNVKNLYQVTDLIAEDYAKYLITRVGNSSFNTYITILSYITNVVSKKTKIPNNWTLIQPRRHTAESRRELTSQELSKLITNAANKPWLKNLLMIGAYTGLRKKDCCLLKWSHISDRYIRIIPAKNKRLKKTIHIPIHPELQKLFDSLPKTGTYVNPYAAEKYLTKRHVVDYWLDKSFAKICDKCSRPPNADETTKRRIVLVSFHSLRHTFVSICRNAGVPDAVVMSIVGHSNKAMTQHYTHVGDLASWDAIGKIPNIETSSEPVRRSFTQSEVIRMVQQMTPDTWQEIRQQIIGA